MRSRSIISTVVVAATALVAALPSAPVAADDPLWSSPLALGPTDATSIAAREGLVVAGGRLHEKGAFGGGTQVIASAPRVAGIFRSTDLGRSWSLGQERIDHPDGTVELRPISQTPNLVAVPLSGPDAFAIFGSAVWRSEDDAQTWKPVGTIPGAPTTTEFLTDGRLVVGLAGGGLRVSADRGATWSTLGAGLPTSRVNQVLAHSALVVLVATDTGVYRSANGGITFIQSTTGLAQPSSQALGVASSVGGFFLAMPGSALTTTAIYASSDGAVWQPRVPIFSQNLLPRVAPGSFEVVVQGSVNVVYAGTISGLFRTGNTTGAGLAWERVEPEPGASPIGALAFEDTNPSTGQDHALYASVRRASPAVVTATTARLAAPGWIDELEGGRVCGGLVARKDGALFAACGRHVFRSDDRGATWSGAGNGTLYLSAGIGDTPYNPLVASADGSLWTSGYHYGLYHSNAAVTQWSKVPFPGASVGAIGTHPTDANTVYAAGLLTNGATGLLYKSADGGTTWGKPILDLGTSIYNVSVSPSSPNKVLAAAYSSGAWLTEDGGATWIRSTGISGNVYRALYTPASPTRAWALTSDGVFRSDDAGRTWDFVGKVLVNGSEKSTFEIEVSPWDPDTIYSLSIDGDLVVTHDGGGEWMAFDGGLPKDPTCGICEEIQHLESSLTTEGELFIAAGVLGNGADTQSMWIYRAMAPGS